MINREDIQLNYPAKRFFEKKLKCDFSTSEFRFSAGKLDVLAYNRKEKCFHVAEGKYANRVSSVGHAVGQLVAYISMLQESGYDFLNSISKEANLYLTDFTDFLENKSIKVCFYIILPSKQKEKIYEPAELMLKNIGDFGEAIGVLFSGRNKCIMEKPAKPIIIKIRKKYERKEFLEAISQKFLSDNKTQSLEEKGAEHWPWLIQFREKGGNPFLHFEVSFKRKMKGEIGCPYEVAFDLEWSKGWLKNKRTLRRANKIKSQMQKACSELKKIGYNFKYYKKWGKAWSKISLVGRTKSDILESEDIDKIIVYLMALTDKLLPKLNKINWGRRRKKEIEEITA